MNTLARGDVMNYDFRNNAIWSDKLYWSIHSNDLDSFKSVVTAQISEKYIYEITTKYRPQFIIHLNEIQFSWNETHLAYAIRYCNVEAFKQILSFNITLTHYTLLVMSRYGNMSMMTYLHVHHTHVFDELANTTTSSDIVKNVALRKHIEMLKFLLRMNVYVNNSVINKIIRAGEYSGEDMSQIITIFHDFKVQYDWGCKDGKCKICNVRKESLVESWFLERYEYDSHIQWLPTEIMEDLLSLL